MKYIPLFQASEFPRTIIHLTLVDDEDYDELMKYRWCLSSKSYVICNNYYAQGKRIPLIMHRHILQPSPELFVDHINHDKLNNRRSNLRVCTGSQNMMNKVKRADNTTGFKGVGKRSEYISKPYYAQIKVQTKRLHLGTFATPQEAHEAYKQAALKYHGEFANA